MLILCAGMSSCLETQKCQESPAWMMPAHKDSTTAPWTRGLSGHLKHSVSGEPEGGPGSSEHPGHPELSPTAHEQ